MKCLLVVSTVLLVSCFGERLSSFPGQYGFVPRATNQDSLVSYIAVNNPLLVRHEPVIYQEQLQVPQVDVVSHRGSFAHYVNPSNYQTFQASLQSSAVPSGLVTLSRSTPVFPQPSGLAVHRSESRIDIPVGVQGVQQFPQGEFQVASQIGQQQQAGGLSGLVGQNEQRAALNAQRNAIYNSPRGQGNQNQSAQKGSSAGNPSEPLSRRQ